MRSGYVRYVQGNQPNVPCTYYVHRPRSVLVCSAVAIAIGMCTYLGLFRAIGTCTYLGLFKEIYML